MEYSGCHYKDGEEIAGKSGTWEASIESMKADKVEDEKLSKTFKVVKKLESKNVKVKARGRQSKKLKKKIAAKHSNYAHKWKIFENKDSDQKKGNSAEVSFVVEI